MSLLPTDKEQKLISIDDARVAMAYLVKTEAEEALFPLEAAARKEFPISSGLLDYFPNALAEVSRVSLDGNRQHGIGFPLKWDRTKSSDDADAMIRHFMERGTIDERGMRATARMVWRALALLQRELDGQYIGPYKEEETK